MLRELAGPPPVETETPSAPIDADVGEAVQDALSSLDPADRVAVELYLVEELPAETVAKMLGLLNSKAVYNRVYRALAVLRAQLERAGVRGVDA